MLDSIARRARVTDSYAEPGRRAGNPPHVEYHHLDARCRPADSRVEALEVDEGAFVAGARECERAAEASRAAAPPRLDCRRRAHQLAVLGPRPAGGGRLVRERELTVGDEEDGFAVVRAASDRRRREEVQLFVFRLRVPRNRGHPETYVQAAERVFEK